MSTRPVTIEICVEDVESAIAAEVGGADRVELCGNLARGGTTPSAGAIAEAARFLSVPVHVLVRPRVGDFVYSERELAVMRHDIEAAKALGAAGVVLGALDATGRVERDQTAAFIDLARPLSVTFHKAVDQTVDLIEALEALAELGADRVLTSGGRPTAAEGADVLKALVERAGDRIAVMAGGRLGLDNLAIVVQHCRAVEIHLGSAAARGASAEPAQTREGPRDPWERVDAQKVAALVALVRGLEGQD